MMPEFEQMLQAVLPAIGKTSLTLTDIPRHEDQLMEMLETAFGNWQRGVHQAYRNSSANEKFSSDGESVLARAGGRFRHVRCFAPGL